ncbi:hypothetical protein CPB86DRAFT_771423 [Serendipita vermifera]|nr:hypothetical protein CPB86DRAFT_771423 [Serendipita vermifera]
MQRTRAGRDSAKLFALTSLHHDDEEDEERPAYPYRRRKHPSIFAKAFIYAWRSLDVRTIHRRPITRFIVFLVSLYGIVWFWHSMLAGPVDKRPIYHEEDIQRVWEWEILSGHWMSYHPIKAWFRPSRNPSLPSPVEAEDAVHPGGIVGCGWNRQYIHSDDFHHHENTTEFPSSPQLRISQFPPRPVPGSIADLELVSQYCDIATGQYLSNCLEYLQIGAALNTLAPRSRRQPSKDNLHGPPPRPPYLITSKPPAKSPLLIPYDWRYLYLEERTSMRAPCTSWRRYLGGRAQERRLELASPQAPTGGVPAYTIGGGTEMEEQMKDWGPEGGKPTPWTPGQCEKDYPRVFHTYLEKPPTDRLYMALVSFLYTQNLGLHLDESQKNKMPHLPCTPEVWVWVDHRIVQESKLQQWISQNTWTQTFMDARFTKFIKFKIWDGTEQMDATVEWSKEWRDRGRYSHFTEKSSTEASAHSHIHERREVDETSDLQSFTSAEELHTTLNVSMTDTASWLLPHRYGGMFVSPEILFLRDFEEIWNYRGAFGTFSPNATIPMPVLKLNKGSGIGTVMLRMGLRYGLKLDKESVRRYARELGFEEMLTPFPDLLADLAFSSSEEYQKARLPVPSLPSGASFFDYTTILNSSPQTVGLQSFFRGAWFYHAHSAPGIPYDVVIQFADIGTARSNSLHGTGVGPRDGWNLSWSSVIKRTMEMYLRGESPNMYGEYLKSL